MINYGTPQSKYPKKSLKNLVHRLTKIYKERRMKKSEFGEKVSKIGDKAFAIHWCYHINV